MKWEQASLSQVLEISDINNKNSSVAMLPRDMSCMLYQGLGCYFLGIMFTSLFLRMQGQSRQSFQLVLLVRQISSSSLFIIYKKNYLQSNLTDLQVAKLIEAGQSHKF